jgi:outer membrane protein
VTDRTEEHSTMNSKHLWAAAACLALAGTAQAQSEGTWLLRVGATQIRPHVSSGDLSAPSLAGTQADVKSASQLSGGIAYMLSDHLDVDLPLALPFKHDIVGAGAVAGAGKIGEVKALPITLLVHYRFLDPQSALRPYVGVGLTYAKFFKARSTATLSALTGGSPTDPTTMKVDSRFGATAEIGASYSLGGNWFIDASVTKTLLKTTTTLSTGQTMDIKLDPVSISFAIGRSF